LNWNKEYRR